VQGLASPVSSTLVARGLWALPVLEVILAALVPACQTPAARMELLDALERCRPAEEWRRSGWQALPVRVESRA
jgi:hypothetical protein